MVSYGGGGQPRPTSTICFSLQCALLPPSLLFIIYPYPITISTLYFIRHRFTYRWGRSLFHYCIYLHCIYLSRFSPPIFTIPFLLKRVYPKRSLPFAFFSRFTVLCLLLRSVVHLPFLLSYYPNKAVTSSVSFSIFLALRGHFYITLNTLCTSPFPKENAHRLIARGDTIRILSLFFTFLGVSALTKSNQYQSKLSYG